MDEKARPNNEQNGEKNPLPPGSAVGEVPDRHAKGQNRPAHDRTSTPEKKCREPQSRNDRRAWRNTTIANRRLVWLTAVVAVANCLYALLAWRQLVAMHNQLTAMNGQASIMSGQLEHMKTASRLENCPWITAENAMLDQIAVAHPIKCVVTLRNSGKTPARDFHATSGMFLGPPNVNADTLVVKEPVDVSSQATLAANGTVDQTAAYAVPVDEALFQQITRKERWIYVVGKITYRDVFTPNDIQHASFCIYCRDPNTREMGIYKQGNE